MLFDPELEKKKKKINDKLMSINKLKDLQAEGKTLEKNQASLKDLQYRYKTSWELDFKT